MQHASECDFSSRGTTDCDRVHVLNHAPTGAASSRRRSRTLTAGGLWRFTASVALLAAVSFPVHADPAGAPQSEELRALIEAYGRIKNAYVDPIDEKKLVSQAIKGMIAGLDPHSSFLDSDALGNWRSDLQGEFGGLGVDVDMEDGLIKIISPIEDTPASRAGLQAGDLISKLDNTEIKGLPLREAMSLMRGKPNTSVLLTILRKGEANPLTMTLTRALIRVKSVKSKLLEPGYGYVRLTQFQEHTPEQLALAIEALYRQNGEPLRGLVLDLRDNPGGLVSSAVAVSAAFLAPDVPVVDLDGRNEEYTRHLRASAEYYLRGSKDDYLKRLPTSVKSVPLVVLVNGGSASASEIVAGALQDHKRATIAGTQTFGKGSVQTTLALVNNTAIKLTTARYFTPGGHSIQAKGITPDVAVSETADPIAATVTRVRESDLEHHLSNPEQVAAAVQTVGRTTAMAEQKPGDRTTSEAKPVEKAAKVERPNYGSQEDYQLSKVLTLLKGFQTVSR
ncbi:MAG: S41 family peptidase [Betaproteobacteria bacterium]